MIPLRRQEKGRPSIDPVVFFKLQLVMFFEGLRSERQALCQHNAERYEDILDRVRAYCFNRALQEGLTQAQGWVEPLLAEGKQWHGMSRFRLRLL